MPAIHLVLAALLAASRTHPDSVVRHDSVVRQADVAALVSVLADDSMLGRLTGTPGAHKAAAVIAAEMSRIGLKPLGDSGYFQRVPLAMTPGAGGPVLSELPDWAAFKQLQPGGRLVEANVVGMLPGSDPTLRGGAVLIDAHYDHLGVGPPVAGDSIYNGADDDASGVVAVLEIARALAAGPRPKRTVVFLATTGEEVGLLGTDWYVAHPAFPLEHTVANLEIEMIGRPDSLVGGAGHAWLTGFERTTMGPTFKAAGLPIVADARPDQNFFQRSDNIAFARRGIPAQTLSTFDLHADYHQPSDEVSRVDMAHVTAVIQAAARAVSILANGAAPTWVAGGRP